MLYSGISRSGFRISHERVDGKGHTSKSAGRVAPAERKRVEGHRGRVVLVEPEEGGVALLAYALSVVRLDHRCLPRACAFRYVVRLPAVLALLLLTHALLFRCDAHCTRLTLFLVYS